MKTKILTLLLVQFMALSAFAGNVITYTASEKLPGTASTWSSGLHVNAFNVAISRHTFSNGTGTITFEGDVTRIGDYAFYHCTGLTAVTIPNSVTSIGDWAFSDCSGLTSVTIPNSVTSIGIYAFCDCSGLTSIVIESGNTNYDSRDNCNAIIETSTNTLIAGCKNTVIPNSVTSIVDFAFYGCSGLTSITIPNSVTSIGICAFAECSGLTSIVVESGNTNYDSRDNCNAIIKTSTNTLIAGCKNTVIPNSVTNIGDYAFRGCTGLTSITIPNSVTSIGEDAFEYCSGLTSITIPNTVTSIGEYAFYECSGLTSITSEAVAPPSCGGSYCFYDVDHSIPVYVPAASVGAYKTATEWMDFTNIQAIQATTQNTITYTANKKLWETTDTYSSGLHTKAFNVSITSHTFSNGTGTITFSGEVTSIGDDAFYDCSGLTSITIPNSVTNIGKSAFSGCSGLTSITIPNSVTSIGNWAFSACSGLTSIVWNAKNCSSTLYYSHAPFYGSGSQITDFTLGEEVESVPNFLCSGMNNLTSITIPNSVTSIGDYIFYGCSGLTSIVVESGNTNYDSRDNCNAIIETSTNTLIAGCKNTVIPNSVTTIGYRAFYGCSSLTSITIPNSVTSIGDYTFYYCSGLTSITIPNSVTSIGDYTFYYCSGLTSITIPNSVTSIGGYAFSGCSSLTSITIPNSVTSIGDGAFKGCSSLTSITIPNSVTSIGNNAFYDCSGVTELTIGSLVSSIGNNAFYGCKRLVTITCFATNPPTAYGNSFQYYDCDLYVPCDELRTYKRDEVFGQFENIQCIGAESGETVTDVVTTPSDNTVTILWPKDDAASTYTIVITKDGITICTLTFNAAGQLMNIAFAPGRDTEMPSHAAESINGSWSFTVTGLNSGTKYEYSVTTKNSAQSVLSSYSGSFTTTGLVPTSLDNTSIEMQTTKFFRDGQLHIIRDEKIYTVEGVLVE